MTILKRRNVKIKCQNDKRKKKKNHLFIRYRANKVSNALSLNTFQGKYTF